MLGRAETASALILQFLRTSGCESKAEAAAVGAVDVVGLGVVARHCKPSRCRRWAFFLNVKLGGTAGAVGTWGGAGRGRAGAATTWGGAGRQRCRRRAGREDATRQARTRDPLPISLLKEKHKGSAHGPPANDYAARRGLQGAALRPVHTRACARARRSLRPPSAQPCATRQLALRRRRRPRRHKAPRRGRVS